MRLLTPSIVALAVSSYFSHAAETPTEWQVNAPQGQFQQVDINVQQGTWMNVSVSPDGSTLVFDLLGDIYTMPISGGQATALTQDIAWNMQPVFSPDGRAIAFTSDRDGGDNIWVMDSDGQNARAVTKETFRLLNSPAWSPDGQFIVARKHFTASRSLGAGEVWQYHVTGGSGVMLTERDNDQKDLGEPAFSPDGKHIYFSQDDTPGKTFHYSKDSEAGIYTIKRFERQTGDIEVILGGAGGAIRPTPSPDGNYLAYIRRVDFQSTLFLYDLKSGEHIKLYDGLDRDMQETWAIHGVYPTLSWTPDNRSLVFWAGGEIKQLHLADKKVKTIPFSVSTQKQIQTAVRVQQDQDQTQLQTKMHRFVQVSPDGKQAVFTALGHLYITDLDDPKPRRLTRQTTDFEFYPQFSRDGRELVYVSWNDQTQGAVNSLNLRNNRLTKLTNDPGKYVEPTFSPDGKTVVYRKIGAGSLLPKQWSLNTGLYKVSSRGGNAELIARNGRAPMFGANNEKVYAMDFGTTPRLISIDLTKHTQQTLYTAKFGTEFKLSPNGQYLAFADRFKVFVTPFIERGKPIDIGANDKQLPVKQLSMRAGEYISWNADSNQLYWSLGPDLYQASTANLFTADANASPDAKIINLSVTAPIDIPRGVVAFVGGQVITMKGDEVLQDAVVVVENNKIIAVGEQGTITLPANAKIFDITGKTLMPGLFDAHAHGSQGVQQITPKQNWQNYASLTFGVTSIHDPSNDTREIFSASELQRTGQIVGPRIFSTGTILYGAEGAGYTSHIDSLDDAKFHLTRLQKAGAFSVKSYNQPRRNQRQQVIQAARELNMMVVPEGGSLMQHNLTMIVDGHTTIEHALPAAKVYDDVKQLWQASGTAYTPTLNVAYGGIWGENYWYDKTEVWKHPRLSRYVPMDELAPRSMRRPTAPEHHYNHFNVVKTANELKDVGVVANIGAHGQREGLGAHWEIWMFAQGGMTPLDALRTATLNPAKTFGMDHQLGSIEVGKLADLIVIDGNPLDNIRVSDQVIYTMVNGRLFDAASMNEIGLRERQRQAFYFEPR
ncbi:amidohydrolase family protein [Alishewanella tabrizica]|uniref:Bifunctional TolB-family protein/amidohydrolase n=1 Tax=Alishewanella tabrizica TaxID=671278 RepID=A0ABQ2WQ05_9ALTE|nr:amidohydrolase family protein [Alishewanella tabrizica]GGW67789.1 bifunctional TolB-family protein/amidohydrolase [Alishewanella tabrizica]